MLSNSHAQLDYSAPILAVLSRFRYDISSFNGEKIHSLTNVMTMQHDMRDAFDRLGGVGQRSAGGLDTKPLDGPRRRGSGRCGVVPEETPLAHACLGREPGC